MKNLFLLLLLVITATCVAQNNTYNSENQGIYYPNLTQQWVIAQPHGDTLQGYWKQDTFFQDDNIHSYIFRDSGIETRWNMCQPPTNVVFKTQRGLAYHATYWTFRQTTEGIFLLGFDNPDKNGVSLLIATIKLERVRYDPVEQRVVGYQNGIKCIVRNPISLSAFQD